jgi:hypothetical protein
MSTENTQILFMQGDLDKIARDNGEPFLPGRNVTLLDGTTIKNAPDLINGTLWFAKQNNTSFTMNIDGVDRYIGKDRAYIYLDDGSHRYVISSPTYWNDVINVPVDNLVTGFASNIETDDKHTLKLTALSGANCASTLLPFVSLSGDTMTGPLTIARDADESAPRVSLDYNATTQSLDFTFT